MLCPRCDGLLIEQYDRDSGSYVQCVNCGGIMPRFRDEAHRQEFVEKCRQTREENKRKKSVLAVMVDREEHRKSNGIGGIATALDEIDSKIAALQQVRKQLIHAQELVSA